MEQVQVIDTSGIEPLGQACLSRRGLGRLGNLCCAILLAVLCTACHQPAKEKVMGSIVIGNRTWDPIQKSAPRKGVDVTLEFLPQGQTKDNWNEMLTVQFFATTEGKVSIDNFVSAYLLKLKNDTLNDGIAQSNSLASRIILKDADMVMFAWQGNMRSRTATGTTTNVEPIGPPETANVHPGIVSATTNNVQPGSAGVPPASATYETDIVRAFSAEDGMHVVQYATKGTISTANEQQWVRLLTSGTLDNLARPPELDVNQSDDHRLP